MLDENRQQQYPPPYDPFTRQGPVEGLPPNEEVEVNRTIRRNFSRTPEPEPRYVTPVRGAPLWLVILLSGIAAVALAIGAYLAVSFQSLQSSTAAQLTSMQLALNHAQSLTAGDRNSIGGLAAQVSNMSDELDGVAAFNAVCSEDFNNASGPAQYWIPCTTRNPG